MFADRFTSPDLLAGGKHDEHCIFCYILRVVILPVGFENLPRVFAAAVAASELRLSESGGGRGRSGDEGDAGSSNDSSQHVRSPFTVIARNCLSFTTA